MFNTNTSIYKKNFIDFKLRDSILKTQNKNQVINADCNVHKYLGDIPGFNELPVNCIFDKGRTGCGGTTLALESPMDYVILMPYYKIVQSKHEQYPNSLAVLGGSNGTTSIDIKYYYQLRKAMGLPIKIISTYNGLEKIINALDLTIIKTINLLVDEYHVLRNDYKFRNDIIDPILREFRSFKTYCFLTATPIIKRYEFEELMDIKRVRVLWKNNKLPRVKIVDATSRRNTLEALNSFINVKIKEGQHIYIFINSLEAIQKVLYNNHALTINNTKLIYSRYSDKKLNDSHHNEFINETVDTPIKPVTFLTAASFEGLDIRDEKGISIVVSLYSKQDFTYHHPDLIKQVIGRNRSRTEDIIYHFVDFKNPKHLSSADKDANTFEKIVDIKKHQKAINCLKSKSERIEYFNANIKNITNDIDIDSDYFITFSKSEELVYDAYHYFIDSCYWGIDSLKAEYINSGFEIAEINSTEETQLFENNIRRSRLNKITYMQALLTSFGNNYEQQDWKEFLERKGNEVYKDVILQGIKTPEEIISNRYSMKRLKIILNDYDNAGNFYDKIMYRIKQESRFQAGQRISIKQAFFLINKIVIDTYWKSGMKGINRDGKTCIYYKGLKFPELSNTDFDLDNDKIVAKKIKVGNYSPVLETKIPYKSITNIKKYLDVRDKRFYVDGEQVRGYEILGFKIIEG